MDYECAYRVRPAQPVLAARLRTPVSKLPTYLGEVYGRLQAYLDELGESWAGPPYSAYYNSNMNDLDTEIGMPVNRALPGRDDLLPGEIPAGPQAYTIHIGPYSKIGPAYDALDEWCKEAGHTATGVAYEVYIDDPQEVPAAERRTELIFLLAE